VTAVPMQVGHVPQHAAGVASSQRERNGSSEMSLSRSTTARLLPPSARRSSRQRPAPDTREFMRAQLSADKFVEPPRRQLGPMTAFHNQLRLAAPSEKVFGLALASFTKPLGKAGFKVYEQDPDHIIWSRDAGSGWDWSLLGRFFVAPQSIWAWGWGSSSSQRITMSFSEAADGSSTLLTIVGDAPMRIARELGHLTL
jgi:hypothetical protein